MELAPLGAQRRPRGRKKPVPDNAWTAPQDPTSAEYEVSRVVAMQERDGEPMVRVRWVGWSAEDDTWEPAATFEAGEKIDEFRADEELCAMALRVNEWRRYLLKDMCFSTGERVTKTERGVARAQILRILRQMEEKVCGEGPECDHARNVLGSCVFDAARCVSVCLGGSSIDFEKVRTRGARVWNAEGSLVDVKYSDILAVIDRICATIRQAIEDEHQTNELELLEHLQEEEDEEAEEEDASKAEGEEA